MVAYVDMRLADSLAIALRKPVVSVSFFMILSFDTGDEDPDSSLTLSLSFFLRQS